MEELVDKLTSADECQTHLNEFATVFANTTKRNKVWATMLLLMHTLNGNAIACSRHCKANTCIIITWWTQLQVTSCKIWVIYFLLIECLENKISLSFDDIQTFLFSELDNEIFSITDLFC